LFPHSEMHVALNMRRRIILHDGMHQKPCIHMLNISSDRECF
jgi:hypothetical protein